MWTIFGCSLNPKEEFTGAKLRVEGNEAQEKEVDLHPNNGNPVRKNLTPQKKQPEKIPGR